jgi:RNA polymerase sigma-70 factor, ECF subfamily
MGGSAISDAPGQVDLVGQVAAGDTDALAALYRLHGAALFRLARRLTTSIQDAEDVLHDLFVGLPESIHKYEGRGSLIGWLKRVLVRLTFMRLRAERRRHEVDLHEEISETRAGRAPYDIGRLDVERVMATLPPDIRTVLVLHQTEGYSHQEIAALLGITPGASRVRLSRAVTLLKEALRGRI